MAVSSNRRFVAYSTLTLASAIFVVWSCWTKTREFYPCLVLLSTSKLSIVILSNFCAALTFAVAYGISYFFLGSLRDNETEYMNERIYPTIMDLVLTVTGFRMAMSASSFAWLVLLFVIKCFHWLVQKRVDFMGQTPTVQVGKIFRLGTFLALLFLFNVMLMIKSGQPMATDIFKYMTTNPPPNADVNDPSKETKLSDILGDDMGPSIEIFYTFEYFIMSIMIIGIMIRFSLVTWEMVKHEGRWDEKSKYLMYSDFLVDVIQFFAYALLFFTITTQYALPFALIRPVLVAFSTFKKRIADLQRYRLATHNMDTRFPDASPQELEAAHSLCIICREDMNQGKKLPCGHVLHLRCLREWLEHQQTCPTCRVPLIAEHGDANQAQRNQNNDLGGNFNDNIFNQHPLHQNQLNQFNNINRQGAVGAPMQLAQNGAGNANGNLNQQQPMPVHPGMPFVTNPFIPVPPHIYEHNLQQNQLRNAVGATPQFSFNTSNLSIPPLLQRATAIIHPNHPPHLYDPFTQQFVPLDSSGRPILPPNASTTQTAPSTANPISSTNNNASSSSSTSMMPITFTETASSSSTQSAAPSSSSSPPSDLQSRNDFHDDLFALAQTMSQDIESMKSRMDVLMALIEQQRQQENQQQGR